MAPPYAADHVNIVVELSYVMSSHTHTPMENSPQIDTVPEVGHSEKSNSGIC